MWKLCDFGSATTRVYQCADETQRRLAEEDIERNTTMAYRAPEVRRWQFETVTLTAPLSFSTQMVDLYRRQEINESVDIWALGCFLFKVCINFIVCFILFFFKIK